MIRNILLSALASLKRKKMVSVFTILTISLGMTMIILLAAFYDAFTGDLGPYSQRSKSLHISEVSYLDKDKKIQRRYKYLTSSFINEHIKPLFPSHLVGFYGRRVDWEIGGNYENIKVDYIETDHVFWKIHSFTFLSGKAYNKDEVVSGEKICVLSRKAAEYIFGKTDVAGEMYVNRDTKYRITGVVENIPAIYDVAADIYVPYNLTIWGENRISPSRNGTDIKYYYNRGAYKITIVTKNSKDRSQVRNTFNHYLEKLNRQGSVEEFDGIEASLESSFKGLINKVAKDQNNRNMLIAFSVLFLLIISIPILILINLNGTSFRERLEEIGIRKTYGATKIQIVRQFIAENLILSFAGTVGGLILAYFSFGILCSILFQTQNIYGFEISYKLLFLSLIGTLFINYITSIRPSQRAAKVHPVWAIHGIETGIYRNKTKRKVLHISTYVILSLLFYFLFTIYVQQVHKIFTPLGYDRNNVISIIVSGKPKIPNHFAGLKEEILKIDGVVKASYTHNYSNPLFPSSKKDTFMLENIKMDGRVLQVDNDFFDLLKIQPIVGKLFSLDYNNEMIVPMVINQKAVEKYFNDLPVIGTKLSKKDSDKKYQITGIIKHYRNSPLFEEIPVFIQLRNSSSRGIIIRFSKNANLMSIENKVNDIINEINGAKSYYEENNTLNDRYNRQFKMILPIFRSIVFILIFLTISVLLGFFTLNWGNVSTRKKELGIRRAIGANKLKVIFMVVIENLWLAISGTLIGSIISLQLLSPTFKKLGWEMNIMLFALSTLSIIILTLLSSLLPALNAARVHPIEALSEE